MNRGLNGLLVWSTRSATCARGPVLPEVQTLRKSQHVEKTAASINTKRPCHLTSAL